MEEKNKGGRPPIKNRADVRDCVVSTRLTKTGYGIVKGLADRSGRSVNDYLREVLRMLAMGEVLIRVPPPEKKQP